MKRFALVLITVLALLTVSVAPAFADDLPEAGTAAPGAFTDVSGGVAGKAGAPAQPPVGTIKLSKTGSKWIDNYMTKLSWGNYVVRGVEPWKGRPASFVESYVTDAAGFLFSIQRVRTGNYMCANLFGGCSPWFTYLTLWGPYAGGYAWWCTGCPAHAGAGIKSVSRHTFGWLWGGTPQQFDTYLIVSGWVTP